MNMKRVTVPFEVKQMEEDKEFYKFEGYASTFGNVDFGSDRVMTGAFKACIDRLKSEKKNLPVLWQHDMTMPLGVFVEIKEDQKGLFVKGRMPKADDFVRGRVFPQMKAGSVGSMSIGYMVDDFNVDGNVRNLIDIDLREISLVTMPMNDKAVITDMKRATPFGDLPLADASRTWDSTAAIGRVRQFTDSVDEPSAGYKRAFFYYDPENDDTFGGYKLLFADVIDGKLTAVPRGIFAAAATMRGARGGVDIPGTDRSAIESNITKYYEKMGRESPFEDKCLIIDEIDAKNLTERLFEGILRMTNAKFTKQGSKTAISILKKSGRDALEKERRDAEIVENKAVESKLDELLKLTKI